MRKKFKIELTEDQKHKLKSFLVSTAAMVMGFKLIIYGLDEQKK